MKVRYRKHGNFHVPKQYLRGTICDEVDTMLANKHHGDWDITAKHVIGNGATKNVDKLKKITPGYEREDYIKMDGVSSVSWPQLYGSFDLYKLTFRLYSQLQNIILGYERNSFLLFLIPTLFCWNFFLWALMSILEISLHMLSHYKNSLTMQKNLYFRSPLHVLSSQFCAICRNESGSKYNRTFDILNEQMRLAHRSDALKNMAKAMG